ncbi:hypothetical protein A3I27_00750 [Candidatus Giovannonibacteria bacterium RIFCSPLOWO2_02_FULL_43_11b]|uniref:DUF2238 domain-containing protein n=1 Tax=Candidatus Giovannonibacteria bacterium RIFCSPHIGHO2_12_FULL_43_15 TaxID=1798341 RepID=A0A1F5WQ41_9BACT|nr:MAG: hypothetical protein A2739_01390 [Candidatus Giovannonibacteria bacterium RIFCSPHIGHO2_01_FULL_43_100]OGF66618.1 MAG: hypothetical protein A3B97_00270 [Candidatus Giovannonibacteria bacterium RIFCSPHIGHO2_02_FULL_43_32]OGF77769.1 MAG: hypothetical protein A3F23_04380 [Candidatus Giovannonibacteria bacterium RIFCSPHIGHO2_12_FULL_43_15]OGF89487.1 MAG: hypothetical protein A3I27_00750 [Candidatus Giovannonibacteria bacterium RIFCSPLOWO2_02_FULL_43_11b]OGF92278.1 MAG: hypothetical protein A
MALARILLLSLIGFESLNFLGFLPYAAYFSWIGLLITSIGSLVVIEIIYYIFKREGVILPTLPYIVSGISLWLDALGDVGHLYAKFSWYDQAAHIIGGAAIMSVAIAMFSQYRERHKISLALMFFISISFVGLFGSLYEIEEYLEDRYYHGEQKRLGNGPDTADDLLMNLLGGLAGGAAYAYFSRKLDIKTRKT